MNLNTTGDTKPNWYTVNANQIRCEKQRIKKSTFSCKETLQMAIMLHIEDAQLSDYKRKQDKTRNRPTSKIFAIFNGQLMCISWPAKSESDRFIHNKRTKESQTA